MKKLSLNDWGKKLQSVAQRFTFTLFFIFGLSFLFLVQINQKDADIDERLWAFLSIAIALTTTVTLFSEEFKNKLFRIGLNLVSILLLAIYIFTLPDKFETFHYYQLINIGIVFTLGAFVVSFLRKNADVSFWEFSKTTVIQLIISGIFSQVLMMGLSLAVLSLQELFKLHIDPKVYGNIAVFCYGFFAPIYFLANVPDEDEKRKQEFHFNKFLKILGLYILLPILAIYTVILYVYLIQIIGKWELPNGWVSTLVSVLGLGGFLSMFILFPMRLSGENKIVTFLSRYFPLILLPLLVLMSVGIFRRLGDYGLTINRLYVLILNVWLYGISIYLFLSKANHLKWIVISFITVAFLSSVGPWSVFGITRRTINIEIAELLNDASLLKDGKIILNTNKNIKIEQNIAEKLSEKISYFSSNFGNDELQQYFTDSIQEKSVWELKKRLGINDIELDEKYFNAFITTDEMLVDIKDYNSFINIPYLNTEKELAFSNKQLDVSFKNYQLIVTRKNATNNSQIVIPLKEKLKSIIDSEKEDNSYTHQEMSLTGDNYKIIFNSLSGQYFHKNDSISIKNMGAQLFLK
jgi:hypothetical protein